MAPAAAANIGNFRIFVAIVDVMCDHWWSLNPPVLQVRCLPPEGPFVGPHVSEAEGAEIATGVKDGPVVSVSTSGGRGDVARQRYPAGVPASRLARSGSSPRSYHDETDMEHVEAVLTVMMASSPELRTASPPLAAPGPGPESEPRAVAAACNRSLENASSKAR